MSVCANSLRALPRSRVPRTLVPFLYQTATIQQWPQAVQPIARRAASSPPNRRDDIPFEDETSHGESTPARPSTVTGSERAAFEKLYKKFTSPARAQPNHDIDQIADEYYEDEEEKDASAATIDSVFDSVLSNAPSRPGATARTVKPRKHKPADNLASLAAEILKPQMEKEKSKIEKLRERAVRIKKMQKAERERVKGLLEGAMTDKELWDVLEREVFAAIRAMDLDGLSRRQSSAGKGGGRKKEGHSTESSSQPTRFPTSPSETVYRPSSAKDPSQPESRILFPNYPHYLVSAARTLHTNFPASPLPHNIIPTLKSLGRSSYALGATTSLYKIVLRITWQQQHSYSQICSLLQDMDNGGIECDLGIVNLLDEIIAEYRMARSGRLGGTMQAVLGMEHYGEAMKRLVAWRDVVAKRLGAWSETRVNRGNLVRRVSGEESVDQDAAIVGPGDTLVAPSAPTEPDEDVQKQSEERPAPR